MAIQQVAKVGVSTNPISAIPAGLGNITETSFAWDGITATGNDTGSYAGRNVTAFAYNGSNMWIAFGTKGSQAWSHNGQDWFSCRSALPINQGLYDLDYVTYAIWAGGKWVAVTRLGRIFTGTDQHTWTERTSPFGGTIINQVQYGNGYYLAVGDSGKFAYSTDAITWTISSNATMSTNNIYTAAYFACATPVWIMAGQNGKAVYTTSNPSTGWTASTLPTSGSNFQQNNSNSTINDIGVKGSSQVMIVGNVGNFATSSDGINWTGQTYIAAQPQLSRVVWVGNTSQWVATEPGATRTWWSSSGTTFSSTTINYNQNYFGSNNNTTPIITDGLTKVGVMTYNGGEQLYQYTTSTGFANVKYKIVNFGCMRNYNDSAMESYQPTGLPTGTGNCEMIAIKGSKILAFLSFKRNFGQFHFIESNDYGQTWYSAKFAADLSGSGIGSGPTSGGSTQIQITFLKVINGVWFLGASNGAVYTSTDGETWNLEYSVGANLPVTVEYGNGWYLGVSTDYSYIFRTNSTPNKVYGGTSTWNQIQWSGKPGDQYCKGLKWVGNKWVAIWNRTQNVYVSNDNGKNWRTFSDNVSGSDMNVWGDGGDPYTSWATTQTALGNDVILDYNNGIAIWAGRSSYTYNGVAAVSLSTDMNSWSEFWGMNGKNFSHTHSGYLFASGRGFTEMGITRHSNAYFGSSIASEETNGVTAFHGTYTPVVQVFDNIPMAFFGFTSYRGSASGDQIRTHGFIQMKDYANLSRSRGYVSRRAMPAYPMSKFIQVNSKFLAIGASVQDPGTQPRTSNAGYVGIYEVAAVDATKI